MAGARVSGQTPSDGELRYRTLAETLPQLVVIIAVATGETEYENRRFIEFHGAAGLSAAQRRAAVHPADFHRLRGIRDRILGGERRCEAEARLRRHDGVYRWHKVVTTPIVERGVIVSLLGTALDIDEMVTARQELERATELLRVAQAAANAGVWEWDALSDHVSLSPASARMHGLAVPEHGADQPVVLSMAEWRTLSGGPEPVDPAGAGTPPGAPDGGMNEGMVEYRVGSADAANGIRWIQSFGRTVDQEGDGRATRLVGLHLDVTARHRVEEALRDGEARLRISEERLALAVDAGNDGLFDIDLRRGTAWVSGRWLERLGYDPAAVDPRVQFWMEAVHPDDAAGFLRDWNAHLAGQVPAIENEHRLRRADGRYVWVLLRARVAEHGPDGRPLRMVGSLANVSRRKEAELRITYMAEHDALTGLPNRYVFRRELERILGGGDGGGGDAGGGDAGGAAVLLCDLDRFKTINDTLGHSVGDQVLCATAERFRAMRRPHQLVARLGCDEFAVILAGVGDEAGIHAACEAVKAAFGQPLLVNGLAIDAGISIGAVPLPSGALQPEEVFKRAYVALSQAKAAGRGTHFLYEAAGHARIAARGALALDMKEAMRHGDFFLVYQPIIDAASGTVTSCEALLRWQHPLRGVVSPGDFIPVAEECGMIVRLGSWALEQACREAVGWPDAMRVAVNVSTIQCRCDLEAVVAGALDASGLAPHRLKLEITESALLEEPDQMLAVLRRLKLSGVRIALDDFGTGYSSLNYLRRFPFDEIKIDRSFVQDIADPDAAAIVRAVVGIGTGLGIGTVAEGVETREQFELVRREGCAEVQGFLFSPPLRADALHAHIGSRPFRARPSPARPVRARRPFDRAPVAGPAPGLR